MNVRRPLLAFLLAAPLLVGATPPPAELRVCADPANLPFSNDKGEGFENRLAELVARELHMRVRYTWFAQRRGFFRNTLKAGECDVVMGVPATLDMVTSTRPYYRSSYVFVTHDRALRDLSSFDDARLRSLRIGVPLAGDDYDNPPPVAALARRSIVDGLVGFPLGADRRATTPAIVEALQRREIDVAVMWGPTAGHFAKKTDGKLTVTPVREQDDGGLPMAFDIAMGVRKKDRALASKLDAVIVKRRADIDRLLAEAGVPRP